MQSKISQYKNEYLEYLEIERNRSPKTLENYGRYLDRFLSFVTAKTPEQLSEDMIRQYRLFLNRMKDSHGNSLKRVTQNYHVIAVRNFLKYLAKRDIQSVPAEKIELGAQEEREVTFLESHELDRFLNAPEGSDLTALRDRAILRTLFSTGMRVSELCSLNRDRIDVQRGEVPIRGKGNKIRLVFLSDTAREALTEYGKERQDIDQALFIRIPKNHAFGAYKNLRLTPRSVQRIVKKYATIAGIMGKDISPHKLRHTFATDLLRNGADIRSVQALLGHSSVTTTQIYTHVTDKQLREVHEKFHKKK